MRIALVSPYSWSYPGGVARHIEALGRELRKQGHEVDVYAPYDHPSSATKRRHQGVQSQERPDEPWLIKLGSTIGVSSNGSMANICFSPKSILRLRDRLEQGQYDVVHLHEPHCPVVGWDTLKTCKVPMVGTFHCFSDSDLANGAGVVMGSRRRINRLVERVAVSEAAAWTAKRYYGGRYTIIPNGVDLALPSWAKAIDSDPASVSGPPLRIGRPMRFGFVGQAVERKGLSLLLNAFAAVREHEDAELVIVGPSEEEVKALAVGQELDGVTVLGLVTDEQKSEALNGFDMLVAPSLGGESFGMVLSEAFAHGVPVIASNIVGYRDVVTHGREGVLVPVGDPKALATMMREMVLHPAKVQTLAAGAARSAGRYSWPTIARRLTTVYEQATMRPEPVSKLQAFQFKHGLRPVDGRPVTPPLRVPLPGVESTHSGLMAFLRSNVLRKVLMLLLAAVVVAGSIYAVNKIGTGRIADALLGSQPTWVIIGLIIMSASMFFRAISWRAVLASAIKDFSLSHMQVFRATAIGVFMSATLPARVGEPSRAYIVARRNGNMHRDLPVVVGTLVSQTLINIAALLILGTVMIGSVKLFKDSDGVLMSLTIVPLALILSLAAFSLFLQWRGDNDRGPFAGLRAKLASLLSQVWRGMVVFKDPRRGPVAVLAQFAAWGLQWLSCYVLMKAMGIESAGFGAAAAVLFAVNVTAVLPVTPSNMGVFQGAVFAVLVSGYGVGEADALGYGIVLQAVELVSAFILGMPALLREGVTWKDVKAQAAYGSPVRLPVVHSPAANSADLAKVD